MSLRLCLGFLLLGLSTLPGCRTPAAPSSWRLRQSATDEQAAAAPASPNQRDQGGLLLKTGAIQLGPGVGANAYRWQGDGQYGFPGAPSGGAGGGAMLGP